jgi:REP element-mobilizing transposase RayT
MPLITPHLQARIYKCLHAECTRMRIELIAVGGVDDHVHLLVKLPSTVSIADAVKQLKGSSSHFANHEVEKSAGFRWQGSYGAFSVSERIVPRVRRYIANQEEHHRRGALHRAYEPD